MANPIAMFNPKEFAPPPAVAVPRDTIIAGKTAGIKVYCAAPALATYNELVKLGERGNHWARLIVSGISSLSSSRLGMDNVYTERGKIAYGRDIFYVELPGVMATFEAHSEGIFRLESLNIDKNNSNYFGGQKQSKNPGLWRVTKEGKSWKTKFVNNGRLLKKHEDRYVVISDTTFSFAEKAARFASASLESVNPTVAGIIEKKGFDMHFTPGPNRSDGLVSSKQALNTEFSVMTQDSAQLLANTMYQSKENEGIQWFSDGGGSAVLTKAMQILYSQKVSLKKHTILLNRATTSPSKALELGRNLELTPFDGGQTKGRLLGSKAIAGRMYFLDAPFSAVQRLMNDDSYTIKQAAIGTANKAMSIGSHTVSTIGVVGATLGVLGTGAGIANAPIIGGAGAMLYVTSTIIKAWKGRRKHN